MSTAKTPRTLDSTQQQQLLSALRKDDAPIKTYRKGLRNYLIGCLMLDAGLRVGEVVQLRISHLFFNRAPVRSLVLTKDITKNHKERTIPVNTRLSCAIVEFFSASINVRDWSPSDFVFVAPQSNNCISTRQVENVIETAGLKSLGRPINPHMLRHTFGSNLMRVTDMRTVQELLGHSFITSTQIYTHPNEDDKNKAIAALEKEGQLPLGAPEISARP